MSVAVHAQDAIEKDQFWTLIKEVQFAQHVAQKASVGSIAIPHMIDLTTL